VSQLSESDRAEVLALLEQHHGIGARNNQGAGWLTQRLEAAIAERDATRQLGGAQVVALLRADRSELAVLADALRVGETCLYRDAPQWDALRAHLERAEPTRVRGLSVGCSTGEEAWTLALVIDAACPNRSWRVVGVDRSEPALGVAREGAYPTESARHLPEPLQRRYLTPVPGGFRVSETLRQKVSFVMRDVTTGLPAGSYEVIVCKNVLIYFGEKARAKLVDHLMRALVPGGVLLVARSEVPRLRALGHEGRPAGGGVTFFG
jgi:chemotaxis protein methyltransferase CheR